MSAKNNKQKTTFPLDQREERYRQKPNEAKHATPKSERFDHEKNGEQHRQKQILI